MIRQKNVWTKKEPHVFGLFYFQPVLIPSSSVIDFFLMAFCGPFLSYSGRKHTLCPQAKVHNVMCSNVKLCLSVSDINSEKVPRVGEVGIKLKFSHDINPGDWISHLI